MRKMRKMRAARWLTGAGATIASMLLTVGCAGIAAPNPDSGSGASEDTTAQDHSLRGAELERYVAEGKLPKSFPKEVELVRIIEAGEKIAASWEGKPIDEECTAVDSSPGSYAQIMVIQDAGLTDVKQCGDVWAATQADGTHLLWNSEK